MLAGVPSAGGGMVVVGKARSCCAVSVSGGSFGCAGSPYRIVSCAGGAIVGSFT